MDFINCWPFDVVDLIFQHVSGLEALSLMQVSRCWNQHLNRSTVLKKIVINPAVHVDLTYLLNSKRKYRHIKVVNGTAIAKDIVEIIANPLHEFNSLIMFRTVFGEKKQMEQIMLNTSLTLEKLELHFIEYQNVDDNTEDDTMSAEYDFPRLKSLCLEYYNESRPWINRYIASYPKLESILLGNACDEHLKRLMLKSRNLIKLSLWGKFYDINFYKDMSTKCVSQLEEFIFNDILSSSKEDENLSYFNAFFTSQSKNLRRFETDALLEIDELESAFRMPHLTELFIKGFHYNVEIMEIYLEHLRTKELPAASLKSFSVHFMNQYLLEILAINAKNLEELRVAQFHPSDVSNEAWFPKLEVLKLFFIDSELRKQLKEKSEDQRTHFEKMIVKAISNFNNSIQPLMLLHLQPATEP
ncbi:hypothetical protein ACKWTF_004330 [Chironomus riparius]